MGAVFFDDELLAAHDEVVGGKARGLRLLRDAGVAVPRFAVLVGEELDAIDLDRVLALGGPFAVRSSGVDEDGATASFAGQHHTTIGARSADDVRAAIARCQESFQGKNAQAYRRARGLHQSTSTASGSIGGAVIVQRLIEPDVAGVAFSVDPDDGANVVVIAACYGFGEGVVADRVAADTIRVAADDRVTADVEAKTMQLVLRDSDVVEVAVPAALHNVPALDDDNARLLAKHVRALALRCGHAVDVEWTWRRDSGFAFVQVRPITTRATATKPAAPIRYLFDTSNIAESYPGVTSPLTFSHIKLAYTTAYEASAKLCGVPDDEIAGRHRAFATLLARIDGRVHYHLPSWFAVLALYPGYDKNRQLMLDMMGADGLTDGASSSLIPTAPARSTWRRIAMALRMTSTFRRRHQIVRDFETTMARELAPLEHTDWRSVDADDVVARWHEIRHRLLHGWQAPLLADFLAMLLHGQLRALCAKRGVDDVTIADLFAGADIPSVAPAQALLALAQQIAARPTLRSTFVASTPTTALQLLLDDVRAGAAFALFLARFGARAMHELKLEQPTWRDDPLFVVRQLQDLVRHQPATVVVDEHSDPLAGGRRRAATAEMIVRQNLSQVQRLWFGRLLAAARIWTAQREAMRYARARTFAVLRSMALRLGDALVEGGHLDDRRDVFFLEHDELTGVFDGTATSWNLRGLVGLRRAEDARSAKVTPPDRRHATRGVIFGDDEAATESVARPGAAVGGAVRGIPVVRGRVQGPAKLVTSANDAVGVPGHVLVCPRTDPGFVALFPGARALVVERGSPLSHCAIVARELGLPTIVNARGIVAAVEAAGAHAVVDVDASAGTVVVTTNAVTKEAA